MKRLGPPARRRWWGLVLACVCCATSLSCSSDSTSKSASDPSPTPDSRYPSSIVVLGHSGTTGADSIPGTPGVDKSNNSWATGTNPEVDSVYLQVLEKNPAVKGHAATYGKDGSGVDDLLRQEAEAAKMKPAPELVLIQSIDNDIQCDGSDAQNYGPFEQQLTKVLDQIKKDLPRAKVFFVDQWATVKEYDRVVLQIDPTHVTGTGPCDVVDSRTNKLDPGREKYLQDLVDHYFGIITKVCGQYPRCSTDGGAMQQMRLDKADLTEDTNHLSVSGLHKMAAMVFGVLYG